jgi:hypothetical protein
MTFGRTAKFGVGAAAAAIVALASVGSAPPPTQELPTVTVHHSPT